MKSYNEWNTAIRDYFVEGVPRGTSIYLSADEEAVRRIGMDSLGLGYEESLRDFGLAVRMRVVHEGHRVHAPSVYGRTQENVPRGLAFLACLVLAASRMADENAHEASIDANNYFRRLREVLQLSDGSGRPSGMEPGVEEPVWHEWNSYLLESGFLPTSRRGKEGPLKFINYPISQTLLRNADKDRIRRLFHSKRWLEAWDSETLFSHVQLSSEGLSSHLRNNLLVDEARLAALSDAIHEVYEEWRENPHWEPHLNRRKRGTTLYAGLLRREDPILGDVTYLIYPRRPAHRRADYLQIVDENGERKLQPERPGRLEPFGQVTERELDTGKAYDIVDHPDLRSLILPRRDFWILVPDPEDPESGDLGTWGRPALGVPFTILCRTDLVPQLDYLEQERLIAIGERYLPFDSGEWAELSYCQVISRSWSGVHISSQALKNELRPLARLSVSLSGGMRVPSVSGWIVGHGPDVTVFGFEREVSLEVTRVHSNREELIFSGTRATNQRFTVPWPSPGMYRVVASLDGFDTQRLVKILSWDDLQRADLQSREHIHFGSWNLSGALLEPSASEAK